MTSASCNVAAQGAAPISEQHGSYTQACVKAIKDGHSKLHAISSTTGLNYRTVNSIVTSLQKQKRVGVSDPWVKRQNQVFVVIHEHKRNQAIHDRDVPVNEAKNALNQLLGMGSLPTTVSIQGRVILGNLYISPEKKSRKSKA
jgi:protein-arginine kinase activator protein McsA